MAGLRNSTVAVVRCLDYENLHSVKKAVRQAVDFIGGLEMVVSPGDTVLIKPNLVCAKHYTTGATTNPYVVRSLVELCRESGAAGIIVGDGAAIGHNTMQAFEASGLQAALEGTKYTFVDFGQDEYQYIVNTQAKIFKRLRIPRTFLNANVVINVPVMKTHDVFGITAGLKNSKGIVHVSDKKRFHKWGLAQSLVDLNHIALPELTVIDGTIAMEGNGPASGDPVGLGIVMAATDTVAADTVACEIMGFAVEQVEYIKLAAEQGLGCGDIDKITVLGEPIAAVRRPFRLNSVNSDALGQMGITLLACDACSGCSHTVTTYLTNLQRDNTLHKLQDHTIAYGQSVILPAGFTGNLIRIGVCTRNLSDAGGIYIPGCPPHPQDINKKLAIDSPQL